MCVKVDPPFILQFCSADTNTPKGNLFYLAKIGDVFYSFVLLNLSKNF